MQGLKKKQFLQRVENEAMLHEDYEIEESLLTVFPFFDRNDGSVYRSSAIIFTLKHIMKREHRHSVVIALREDTREFFGWCGDAFISAGKSRPLKEATDAVELIATNKTEKKQMLDLYGSTKDEPCHFWTNNYNCSHLNMAFAKISDNPDILDQLEVILDGKAKTTKNRSPEQMLGKLQFKKHVLLRGDKGSGKTYLALSFAMENNHKMFYFGGHSKTESSDFIGEYIPTTASETPEQKKGQLGFFEETPAALSMVWKDGPLAEAIRYAATGKKAIFCIDEMLRIPIEELSPLISALTKSPDGKFQLGTRRAIGIKDGLAQEEVLSCDINNLWVIATTNVGSSYSVDQIDEALADRFRMVQMDTDIDLMVDNLKSALKKKAYSAKIIDNLISFYNVYETLQKDGMFNKIMNQRHLIEAIECSVDEDDVKESIWETRLAWIDDDYDGKPRIEQEQELKKILDKVF